jgi:hypothetical protein
MATTRSLEARYRRLLVWFPAEHRREHGEEMAGVLLAAAEPGRGRPGRAESVNLMLSGLRVRLRPGSALADEDGWRDALAIFSVVMPILVLAATCATEISDAVRVPWWWNNPIGIVYSLITGGQLLLVPLVLLGLRRWAMVATLLPLALTGYIVSWSFPDGWLSGAYVLYGSYLVVAGVLELVALLASPGPRRGRQLLRGKRWAYVAMAVVPAAVVVTGPGVLLRYEAVSYVSVVAPLLAISATALIGLGVAWLTSALGKCLAVLFGALVCAYLAVATYQPALVRTSVVPDLLTLLSEVAVAVVAVGVVRQVRHRSEP